MKGICVHIFFHTASKVASEVAANCPWEGVSSSGRIDTPRKVHHIRRVWLWVLHDQMEIAELLAIRKGRLPFSQTNVFRYNINGFNN